MKQAISTKISAAMVRIDEAESALGTALSATEGGARADKVTVNSAVSEALGRLHDARAILADLEISDPVEASQA